MTLIGNVVFFDLFNSMLCSCFGVFVLFRRCNLFTHKHSEIGPTFAIMIGIIGWLTAFVLSLATVIDIGVKTDWVVKHGYTIGRILVGLPWFYFLYLVSADKIHFHTKEKRNAKPKLIK